MWTFLDLENQFLSVCELILRIWCTLQDVIIFPAAASKIGTVSSACPNEYLPTASY
jgi:hypothetical protein